MKPAKLTQSIQTPRFGSVRIGQQAPDLHLSDAMMLSESEVLGSVGPNAGLPITRADYDFNGDGRRDLTVEKTTTPRDGVRTRVTTYWQFGSGQEKGAATFDYFENGKVSRLSTLKNGATQLAIDHDRDGLTDQEVVENSTGEMTVKLKVDGQVRTTKPDADKPLLRYLMGF